MDEATWLTVNELEPLYQYVQATLSDRKKRLFAVACCRYIWQWITEEPCRKAVEAAELYADGRIAIGELDKAMCGAEEVAREDEDDEVRANAGSACFNAARCYEDITGRLTETYVDAGSAAAFALDVVQEQERERLDEATLFQCNVLRDIAGNPFRPAPTIDPTWLRWHDATIPRLAQQMYDSRDFAGMPILADALEEAGCTSADILEHCQGPGPHVRGCWAVDLLLGKK